MTPIVALTRALLSQRGGGGNFDHDAPTPTNCHAFNATCYQVLFSGCYWPIAIVDRPAAVSPLLHHVSCLLTQAAYRYTMQGHDSRFRGTQRDSPINARMYSPLLVLTSLASQCTQGDVPGRLESPCGVTSVQCHACCRIWCCWLRVFARQEHGLTHKDIRGSRSMNPEK